MAEFLRSRIGVGSFQQRLNDMDDEGIDVQIVSLTSPGVQSIGDPEHAAKSARKSFASGASISRDPRTRLTVAGCRFSSSLRASRCPVGDCRIPRRASTCTRLSRGSR